eukprot:6191112-Pleurochrysis_carterae.AAC.2
MLTKEVYPSRGLLRRGTAGGKRHGSGLSLFGDALSALHASHHVRASFSHATRSSPRCLLHWGEVRRECRRSACRLATSSLTGEIAFAWRASAVRRPLWHMSKLRQIRRIRGGRVKQRRPREQNRRCRT